MINTIGILFLFLVAIPEVEARTTIKLKKLKSNQDISTVEWRGREKDEVDEYMQDREAKKRLGEIQLFQLVKKYLISGDTLRARFYLDRIKNRSKLRLVKERYLGLIAFLEGRFSDSQKILENPLLNATNYQAEVCIIKLLNKLALGVTKKLEFDYRNCTAITFNESKNGQIWLSTIFNYKKGILRDKDKKVKYNPVVLLSTILGQNEFIRIWLKLGLYLNLEKSIEEYLPKIRSSAYRSRKIRELISLVYYRLGQKNKALKFIEDISSATAENIKGNIEMEKKKFELAYGHFKLALKDKPNSLNALERTLPISWILEQWEDGVDLLSRIPINRLQSKSEINRDEVEKKTLETAFLIMMNKMKKAEENLNYLDSVLQKKTPLKIDIMGSFIHLVKGEPLLANYYSSRSCRRFDGANCWLLVQDKIWPYLGLTMQREERIFEQKEEVITTLKTNLKIKQLSEDIYIDQRDIEELDSEEVNLPF